MLFSSFCQNNCSDPKCIFVRRDTYQSHISHLLNRVVKQVPFTPVASQVEGSIPGVLSFFFGVPLFFTSFLHWFHNRVPLGPDIYRVLYCTTYTSGTYLCIQSAAAAAAVALCCYTAVVAATELFVIVRWTVKIVTVVH